MKKLLKIFRILQELKCADYIGYREMQKEIYFAFSVSYKVEMSESILGSLREQGLEHLSKDIKRLQKDGILSLVWDDEAFIVSFLIGDLDIKKISDKLDVMIA